jgi:hypothetical protein
MEMVAERVFRRSPLQENSQRFPRSQNTHASAGRLLSRYTELQLPAVPVTAMIGVDALPTFNRFMATCSRLEYVIGMNKNIVDASPLSQPAQCGLEPA